jgi:hypothetical protein
MIQKKMTAVEKLVSKLFNPEVPLDEDIYNAIEQAKEMEHLQKKILNEALVIIRKFVNEFDEEGEVSWNTRDEAANFLNNHKSE